MVNTLLYHVGLSGINSSNSQMKYDIKENNHPDWLNKGPQYNTSRCSKFYGTVFDDFIRNYRTYRCNIMCYIPVHDKLQPTYVDYASSFGGRTIPKDKTTAVLESLGATLKFIDLWIKLFYNNDEVRSKMYNEAMKNLLKNTN